MMSINFLSRSIPVGHCASEGHDSGLSFGKRLLKAVAEYAKFVFGAVLAALICMALYALNKAIGFPPSHSIIWGMTVISVVLNGLSIYTLFRARSNPSFVTENVDGTELAVLAKRVAELEKELHSRNFRGDSAASAF
jgi:hypothetical protein